jgi:hypothetical protein
MNKDVSLKGRSNAGIVEGVVHVRNSEDIVTIVASDRESSAKGSVSVIKSHYLQRCAGK